jgi:hypothetical protein
MLYKWNMYTAFLQPPFTSCLSTLSPCPCVPVSLCPTSLCPPVPTSLCPRVPVSLSLRVPMSLCPCVPLYPCPYVPVPLCHSVPVSPCPSLPLSLCPRVPMFPCPRVPVSLCLLHNHRQSCSSHVSWCLQTRRQILLGWTVASMKRIQSPLKYVLSKTSTCYCRYQIFELCRSFKRSIK